MECTRYQIIKIIYDFLDMPHRKISYIICHKELIKDLWAGLHSYNIPYTQETHELFVDIVQEILIDSNFEKEWSEEEYNNFVCYKE